jgi:hypothetical protein
MLATAAAYKKRLHALRLKLAATSWQPAPGAAAGSEQLADNITLTSAA